MPVDALTLSSVCRIFLLAGIYNGPPAARAIPPERCTARFAVNHRLAVNHCLAVTIVTRSIGQATSIEHPHRPAVSFISALSSWWGHNG
jgi:hypothetical protein